MNWTGLLGVLLAAACAWGTAASMRAAEERIRHVLAVARAEDALAREQDAHAVTRQEMAEVRRVAASRIAALTAALDQAQAQARDR